MEPNRIAALFDDAGNAAQPPAGWPPLAIALWWEARGDWERAHQLAQADESPVAAHVHAYLHRVEGDLGNARYWYRRAGVAAAIGELAAERLQLAAGLLG